MGRNIKNLIRAVLINCLVLLAFSTSAQEYDSDTADFDLDSDTANFNLDPESFNLNIGSDTIAMKPRAFGGTKFIYKGKKLRPAKLVQLTSVNEEALKYTTQARKNSDASSVLFTCSAIFVGVARGLATANAGPQFPGSPPPQPTYGPLEVALMGGGIVCTTFGIVLTGAYFKNARKGAKTYNRAIMGE